MPRRNLKTVHVWQRANRSRLKHDPLLGKVSNEPVSDLCDFFATENADQRIDLGAVFEQLLFLPFSQAPGNDNTFRFTFFFKFQHLIDGGKRFRSSVLDEAACVDDNKITTDGIGNHFVPIKLQQAHHPFAIDSVLRASEADEGVASFEVFGCRDGLKISGQGSGPKK